MTKILIVEDEAGLRQGLEINLRLENYDTVQAADGEEAIRQFHAEKPDLVLLDLMLPKKSGFEVLDHIRKFSKIPVILLTARGQETDKVRGLRGGADDYVTKPFGVDELLARLRAAMRRVEPSHEPVYEIGGLRVDLEKQAVWFEGKLVQLTPHEFGLLRLFVRNEGKLLTHSTILREVWGRAYADESHYLHVYVSQLRRKIEPDSTRPRYILTEPGAGYRLVAPNP